MSHYLSLSPGLELFQSDAGPCQCSLLAARLMAMIWMGSCKNMHWRGWIHNMLGSGHIVLARFVSWSSARGYLLMLLLLQPSLAELDGADPKITRGQDAQCLQDLCWSSKVGACSIPTEANLARLYWSTEVLLGRLWYKEFMWETLAPYWFLQVSTAGSNCLCWEPREENGTFQLLCSWRSLSRFFIPLEHALRLVNNPSLLCVRQFSNCWFCTLSLWGVILSL